MNLFSRLSTRSKYCSLRSKLKLSYFLIAFFPLVALSVCSFSLLYHFSTQKMLSDYKTFLTQSVAQFNYQFGQVEVSLDYLSNDTEFAKALQNTGTTPWMRYINYKDIIDPTLSMFSRLSTQNASITIYQDNPVLDAHRPYILKLDDMPLPYSWEDLYAGSEIMEIQNDSINFYVPMVKTSRNAPIVIINAQIPLSYFFSTIDPPPGSSVALYDKNNNLLWEKGDAFSANDTYKSDNTMRLETALPNTNWTLALTFSKEILFSYLKPLSLAIGCIILLCIISIAYISRRYTNSIVGRLTSLSEKMNEIEQGNLSTYIVSPYNDEIGQLYIHFNNMASSLHITMQKLFKSELDLKDAENRALRAQINPHFLYNTLSMINWNAIDAGNLNISKQVTTLSKFYRTALNHGKITSSLNDEIQNIKSYIYLQQLMHSNTFSVTYDIPEELLAIEVPTFILQPLIENAIVHGIDTIRDHTGKIYVSASLKDSSMLSIVISNTGTPFTSDAFAQAISVQSNSYGLKNVYERVISWGLNSTLALLPPYEGYTTSIQMLLQTHSNNN